jgi:hypothetical protein
VPLAKPAGTLLKACLDIAGPSGRGQGLSSAVLQELFGNGGA